jgi:glycosyltransferase involved in cell wall biosynthesis
VIPRFYPFIGGLEQFCYGLSKYLSERGHEVHVITSKLDHTSPSKERMDGFYVHRCICLGDFLGLNPLTFVAHKLLNMNAEVIHAQSYIFLTSNQAALIKKLSGIPLLLHLHGVNLSLPLDDSLTRLKYNIKSRVYDNSLGKWTVKAANALASVSKRDIIFAEKLWNLERNRIFWVPNAINMDEFNINEHDELNVVFIGRLEPWKGVHTFLKVAKLVTNERDDVNFLIVGDGSLKEYAKSHENNRIKVLGKISHERIPSILAQTSIMVLPSYLEGLPTCCIEALAAGVPVVATRVGGTPEVIIDGETGYLFSPGNTHECADRVLKLLSDEKLRMKMGRKGRQFVMKDYTWQNVVNKVEKIYEKITR